MNVHRFLSLPNALKPVIVLFVFLTILLASSSPGKAVDGSWFFWLNIIVQLVFMTAVCVLFLYEAEIFMGCGREGSWPVVEMSYSGVGLFCNVLNTFILASGHKKEEKSNSFVVAAFTAFILAILYAIGGLMMFRIWRGFVKSGTSQNPSTPNVQPGNIGSMHPGV